MSEGAACLPAADARRAAARADPDPNRSRIPDGKPAGGYDDFVIGWSTDETSRNVWGRPVGLLVLADGSLLISDDGAGTIWRVTYAAPAHRRPVVH